MIKLIINTTVLTFILLCFLSKVFAQVDTTSFGSIKFDLNVEEAILILNNDFRDAYPISNGQTVQVKSGLTSVKLSILNDYLFEKQFQLEKDSLVVISHTFDSLALSKEVLQGNYAARYYLGANALLITDTESNIFLNEKMLGREYSFVDAKTGINNFTATSTNKRGISKLVEFRNSDYTFTVVENYVKPSRKRAAKLAFVPGFSQVYKSQELKGLLFQTSFILAALSTSTYELIFRSKKREYDDIYSKYTASINSAEATTLGDQLSDKNDELKQISLIRNISLVAVLSIYSYNIVDGFLSKPKSGYREVKPIEFYINSYNNSTLMGTLNFNF